MLTLRLSPEIERRLDALAKKTGRSKSWHAREAILRHLDDIEDEYLAGRRHARGGPGISPDKMLDLIGHLEWDESYDYKAERQRK